MREAGARAGQILPPLHDDIDILGVEFNEPRAPAGPSGLNHPIPDRRDAERAFSTPGFGIITRRTGAGRYVFETTDLPHSRSVLFSNARAETQA